MTAIRAYFPKIRVLFPISEKGRRDLTLSPSSSYVPGLMQPSTLHSIELWKLKFHKMMRLHYEHVSISFSVPSEEQPVNKWNSQYKWLTMMMKVITIKCKLICKYKGLRAVVSHCVKSVQIRSFFWSLFSLFLKIRNKKTPYLATFHVVSNTTNEMQQTLLNLCKEVLYKKE